MKNPHVRALFATIYIIFVSIVMYYGPEIMGPNDTIVVPIAMISLFTLSAAVMGYLFVFEPFRLYQVGDEKGAIQSFLKTVTTFACITILILILLFGGAF
ncbi:MAG: hypothetical protein V4664_01600 [Patescibacteria group bacterium]